MTITRETLELAALAAGHTVECTEAQFHGCEDTSTIYPGVMLRGVQTAWRPHLDDGDAARLAVRLDLQVKFLPGCVVAIPPLAHDSPASAQHDGTEPDKLRAWREAVVLCAAAVGERMQKGGA